MPQVSHTERLTMAAAIRRYLDVALFLLIFSGFGTLASTGRLDAPTVVVVTAALLFRGYILARRRQVLLPQRWTDLLTLACVGFFIADEFIISRAFLDSLVHFILFVMLVRLFSAQRDRDHYFLAALSFGMVLAAAVLTVDSTFLIALAGFVMVGVAAMILMEMMHSAERSQVLGRDPQVRRAYRKLSYAIAGIAPALLIMIFALGGLIFFVLPRVSAGYLSTFSSGNELSSGFSDRVELGRIGEIQKSRTVVMHVRIDGDGLGQTELKLRGVALDYFDGKAWTNTHHKIAMLHSAAGRFDLDPHDFPAGSIRTIHYRVTMEPLISDVFFLMAAPHSLEGNYSAVSEDDAGDVFNRDIDRPIGRYEADSSVPAPATLRVPTTALRKLPAAGVQGYLQIPAEIDPRVHTLAEQISAKSATPLEKASVIESYLRTHYAYTLQLPAPVPHDPVADFLFVRRRGHCEYFASAMALMLRTIGIPSRVVNGFSGGEFNDVTSQYVIRASDAHSWVEAYIPGQGWMTFDPTASGDGQVHAQWSRAMLYLDAVTSFWREWIVNYDLAHQLRLGQDASRGSRELVGRAQAWGRGEYEKILAWARRTQDRVGRSTVKWGLHALELFLLALVAFSVPRLLSILRKLRLARAPQKAPQLAASIWYERMLRRAARLGWEKSPAQTPAEFVRGIDDPQIRTRISDFTAHYEKARFGGSAEEAARLPELYQGIKGSS
jgi:transglutaminase-like putative cysteine protease